MSIEVLGELFCNRFRRPGDRVDYAPCAMVMGEIFAAFEALQPHHRFQIGALLRDPFTSFPTTSADFAVLAVPRSGSTHGMFLCRLQDALMPVVDSELSSSTLGALVPRLAGLAGGVETAPGATNRLIALVRANGHRTWGELEGCTIGEIRSWHGAGQQMTTQLVVAAVAAVLRSAPDERCIQLTLLPVVAPRSPIGQALDACLAGLPDGRGRFAFELDELCIDGTRAAVDRPPTHEFLGVSPERTRQLKIAARRHVLAVAGQDAAVERRTLELAALLGHATDRDGLETALESLDLPGISDPAGLLAVWLAGPYRAVPSHDDWWSPRPAELVEATRALLATGGGVHTHDVLIKDLHGLGVAEAHADRWLGRQHVRIEHGLVVDLRGRVADVAARVLEATGRAMSYAELCSWMPSEVSVSALATELRRNPVFIETGPDRWELADWGGEPSAHLVRIRVEVTSEEVSGIEAELPNEIASMLGLRPSVPLTLGTRFGPLALAYDGARVVRSSVRPVILACGAAAGDVLWFVVDPRGLAVEVVVDPDTSTPEHSTIRSTSTAWSTA